MLINNCREKGMTPIEILLAGAIIVVIAIAFFGFGVIGAGVMGNHWYNEREVLVALQHEYPGVSDIIRIEKHVWDYSVVMARENGSVKYYFLDSDIFHNYEFHEANYEFHEAK